MKLKYLVGTRLFHIAFSLCLLVALAIPEAALAYTRTLTFANNSSGGVITGTGINCGSDCTEDIEEGTNVSYTAKANSGRRFLYWNSAYMCSGSNGGYLESPTCNVEVGSTNSGHYAKAYWGYNNYTIKVIEEGTGSGSVSGGGSHSYGSKVTLKATAASGSVFAGWQTSGEYCYTGAGKGGKPSVNTSSTCSLTLNASDDSTYKVVAKFNKVASTPPPSDDKDKDQEDDEDEEKPKLPITEFKLNEQAVDDEKVALQTSEVVLSGKTTPLSTVKLYIHSEPREVSVKADKNGNWSTTVKDLEPGDHTVQAEVIDTETGKTSERKQIAAFTLAAAQNPQDNREVMQPTKTSSKLWLIIGAVVVVLAGAGAAVWLWLRRKHKKTDSRNQTPASPEENLPPTE